MKIRSTREKLSTLAFALTAVFVLNRPAMAQVSAYQRSDKVNSVVFRKNADGHIWELSLEQAPGSTWQGNDLFKNTGYCGSSRGLPGGPVAADSKPMGYIRHDGINAVVYAGTDHNIWELSLQSGHWCVTNLSTNQSPAAPPAAPSASPWGYANTYNKISAVVYRGSNQHIYQLNLASDGYWHCQDVFYNQPGEPPSGDPIGYPVVYVGIDQHVHRFEWNGDTEDPYWSGEDLTQNSPGAPVAAAYSKPTAFISPMGATEIAYTGADGHIYVLYWSDGQTNWGWLKADSGCNATSQSQARTNPVAYKRSDGYISIVYGGYYDVYELASTDGFAWPWCSDLNIAAGGDGWTYGDVAAYVRSDNYNSVVYTEAFTFYIDELTLYMGGFWQPWQLPFIQ